MWPTDQGWQEDMIASHTDKQPLNSQMFFVASRIRGKVAQVSFDEFHRYSTTIIKKAVFGEDDKGNAKTRLKFDANNLVGAGRPGEQLGRQLKGDQRDGKSREKSIADPLETSRITLINLWLTTQCFNADAVHLVLLSPGQTVLPTRANSSQVFNLARAGYRAWLELVCIWSRSNFCPSQAKFPSFGHLGQLSPKLFSYC